MYIYIIYICIFIPIFSPIFFSRGDCYKSVVYIFIHTHKNNFRAQSSGAGKYNAAAIGNHNTIFQ